MSRVFRASLVFCAIISLLPTQLYCFASLEEQEAYREEQSCVTKHCSAVIKKYKQKYESSFCYPRRGDAFAYNVGRDIVSLFGNLWDWDTLKVLVSMFPLFIGSRMVDDRIQNNFFCHGCHCNINQFPGWCHEAVRWSIGLPIALLGAQIFLSRDYELRYTSWMLLLGMPFLIFGKDVIKQFDARFCLRPWHEDFCKIKHKQFGGGFPSGHMAQAVYIAVLFGSRYGAQAAIPLGLNALAVGIVFLNCNRHYLSQLVAGAALGIIFGVAANKVVSRGVAEHARVNIGCDSVGTPGIKVSWKF